MEKKENDFYSLASTPSHESHIKVVLKEWKYTTAYPNTRQSGD